MVAAKLLPVTTAAAPATSGVTAVMRGEVAVAVAVTRTRIVAVTPSLLAETTAVPAATAVMTPSCVTVATLGASELKKNVALGMTCPEASFAVEHRRGAPAREREDDGVAVEGGRRHRRAGDRQGDFTRPAAR